MQELRTKQPYSEIEPGKQADIVTNIFARLFYKINDFFMSLPRIAHLLIFTAIFIIIFASFKSMNNGHVDIASSGNNAENMTILLLICLFLQMLWSAYNGDEGQGFGGM